MLQRYKLRLGDGTVLTVDQDGLRTWLTDDRATVQVAGTQQWRPLRQFLADEESAARLARALVPPEPRRAPAPPPETRPPSPPVERAIGEPSLVQTLAEETGASGSSVPPWRDTGSAVHEAPAIRLKPLDEEGPAPYSVSRAPTFAGEEREEEKKDQEERHDRLEGPLLQVISTLGTVLSRCLDPLTRMADGWPPGRLEEPAPRRSPAVLRAPAAGEGFARLTGWVAGVRAWIGRLAGRRRPEPLLPPSGPAPMRPPPPAARVPLAAPTPVAELPMLRFADAEEAREEEDVYVEEEDTWSPLPALWLWTKRTVLVAALVTGGVLAHRRFDTWFPRAAELGRTVFTEIDRQATSGQRARELEQALADATERLPHLAPATIRRLLSTRDGGVLGPPELFQVASEAADRGRSALPPAEAAELRALERELLSHLRPPERARVAEYDRARGTRVVFPFENPHALELVARGARAMPARSRERLQALLGRAVAAGLSPPAAPPGGPSR